MKCLQLWQLFTSRVNGSSLKSMGAFPPGTSCPMAGLWYCPGFFEVIIHYSRYSYQISHISNLTTVKDSNDGTGQSVHFQEFGDAVFQGDQYWPKTVLRKLWTPSRLPRHPPQCRQHWVHIWIFQWNILCVQRSAWSHVPWNVTELGYHLIL